MSSTERDLRWLLDREEIRDCLHRYTRGIDRHDDELLTSVFHDDAVAHYGDFVGHPTQFTEWSRGLHQSEPWIAHTHLLYNNTIDLDGDTAHSEAYVLFVHVRGDGGGIDFG